MRSSRRSDPPRTTRARDLPEQNRTPSSTGEPNNPLSCTPAPWTQTNGTTLDPSTPAHTPADRHRRRIVLGLHREHTGRADHQMIEVLPPPGKAQIMQHHEPRRKRRQMAFRQQLTLETFMPRVPLLPP